MPYISILHLKLLNADNFQKVKRKEKENTLFSVVHLCMSEMETR